MVVEGKNEIGSWQTKQLPEMTIVGNGQPAAIL